MARTLLAVAIVGASVAGPTAAGAQVEPTTTGLETATIADALGGQLAGVEASAKGGFGGDDTLDITLTIDNANDAPLTLTVPRGALFETDDPTNQTAVARGPVDEDPSLAAVGIDPTITVEPGVSEITLAGYCAQANDVGPDEVVPMTFAGVADAPLPRILHNIAVHQPDDLLAQEAVWWATDRPVDPVREELAPLLEGVDTAAFAAEPHRVVLDERYTPEWRRVEFEGLPGTSAPTGGDASGPGGLGAGTIAGLLVFLVLGAIAIVALTRGGQRPAAVRTGGSPSGWYPDPGDGRYVRYWNGARWTGEVRPR